MQLRNPKEVTTEEYNEFYKKTFNEYLEPLASSHFTTEHVVYDNYLPTGFVNGALHWVASNGGDRNSFRSLIVAFDMGGEVFRDIMMPQAVANKDVTNLAVMVMGTSLALVEYQRFWQSEYCWVWEMKEYGEAESWSRLYNIDMRERIRNVVGLRKNNEVFLTARVKGLVSYDPITKEIKCLGIHGTNRGFYANTHVETLVLLKGVCGVLGQASSSNAMADEGDPL
ncbi:unnamed protein product [Ilex paraguariensis]|uniref:F-box associated beta-propeller type 1 domain-containing protein n=1 Tax=Ilex paraguariensis TaxID=185542 RepID=A0ABC8UHD0_9AQUA